MGGFCWGAWGNSWAFPDLLIFGLSENHKARICTRGWPAPATDRHSIGREHHHHASSGPSRRRRACSCSTRASQCRRLAGARSSGNHRDRRSTDNGRNNRASTRRQRFGVPDVVFFHGLLCGMTNCPVDQFDIESNLIPLRRGCSPSAYFCAQ